MIDKIAMITLLVIMILMFLATLFTYIIIRVTDGNETFREKELEDKEQVEFLRKYKEKKAKKNGKHSK